MKINHDIKGPGKLERVFYKLGILAIIGLGVLIIIFSYNTFGPREILKINRTKIITPSVKVGSMLIYEIDFCKYENITGIIHKSLVNSIVIPLPSEYSNMPMGCQIITKQVMIPEYAPTGKYHVIGTVDYKINSLRTINVFHKSNEFEVID